MAKFDFDGFFRECYLRSEPSVDLNDIPSGSHVDCRDHRLSEENYRAICVEYGVLDKDGKVLDRNTILACNMWMLSSGPKLV